MNNELPWSERVNMLSINPDAATRDDVARMAGELSEVAEEVAVLEEIIEQVKRFDENEGGSAFKLNALGVIDSVIEKYKGKRK
jgi:hypothetical protein